MASFHCENTILKRVRKKMTSNDIYHIIVYFLVTCFVNSELIYDSFSGKPLTVTEYNGYKKSNTTFWCTKDVEFCNPHEARRLDGTCNNLREPSRGARHTPLFYMLPLVFHNDVELRKSESGDDLPLSRFVRTSLLLEGRLPNDQFTHLLTYFMLYMSADVLSFHDTLNYLIWRPYCCDEKGKNDTQCVPIKIPDNDPIYRFSDDRCMNLTRPWTYQHFGCIKNKRSTPKRVVSATTAFDLSQMYTDDDKKFLSKGRLLKRGLLKYEIEEGRLWPPSFKKGEELCRVNQKPRETRCHDIGEDSVNGVLGTNLFTIWMWRHHNYIATELAKVNPCWSDDRIFYTARDINIAFAVQIFYYEFHPVLLGTENMYIERILSPHPGFRDVYNENILPQVSMEYGFVLRWGHTIQEGIAKMYDTEGNYIKSTQITNLTLRTGYLADQNHIDYITQGAFRQPAAKVDSVVDPDIAEIGLGPLQRIADITTSDLEKNRHFGIAPYIKYRKYCFDETIESFDDLKQAIEPEKIELLKEVYKDVNDIDLMAGVWVERLIPGGRVPATFYCLVVNQLLRSMVSDRHWYERPNRPNAFTANQLSEVRKANIASLMCTVGDKVTKIQPNAFLLPGPGNEMRSCDKILKMSFDAWRDSRCDNNYLRI